MKAFAVRPLLAPTRKLSPLAPLYKTPCSSYSTEPSELPSKINPRWLSDFKSRIGKCITFGLNAEQTRAAGSILQELARDWRELQVGSEGFLSGRGRGGLHRQQVVWGEMGVGEKGHVNNVTYIRYAESARVNWSTNFAVLDPKHKTEWSQICTPRGTGLILRSIRCDYKFPMTFPDRVSVYHKLQSEPTEGMDFFKMDVVVVSELHRRAAARCVEDIVVYDYKKGKKAALPAFMLDQFGETYKAQEAAKAQSGQRIEQLGEQVRALEVSSWDRADAVEDVGSAKA
ncbi:hypothetical protein K490DRAFT_42796 [Saccharata proteae CBS 121410]|uniref:Thioesterase/thiol ester dehydrase-isomerase n=1 Tax=Saccharata proteae CBS 121410 TaxID=1314787 RepID=A0A9P4HXR7_9PEZI|nr:hypothetical protein K490DRAFT_42796 [Saccharata proteae CBS 121410]